MPSRKPTPREIEQDLENRRRWVDEQNRSQREQKMRREADEAGMKHDMEERTFESLEYQRNHGNR